MDRGHIELTFKVNAPIGSQRLLALLETLNGFVEAAPGAPEPTQSTALAARDPEGTPAPPPREEPPAPAPSASLEDVRAKLAGLVQSGKQAEVKELLAAFGATKLSEIPAERYGELMEKAGAI